MQQAWNNNFDFLQLVAFEHLQYTSSKNNKPSYGIHFDFEADFEAVLTARQNNEKW